MGNERRAEDEILGNLAKARQATDHLERAGEELGRPRTKGETPDQRAAREKDGQVDASPAALKAALKEAQDRIRTLSEESQQFKHLVASVLNYAIFAMDVDGVIVSWNPGAERMKGWKAEEIIGRHLRELYLPEDRAAHVPEGNLAEAKARGFFQSEGRRRRKGGEAFEAFVSITPIFDEHGRHIGFSKVTQELTAQRKLEGERQNVARLQQERADRELEVAQEKVAALREAGIHKDEFLGILSHELRTPINAIMGFASILEDELKGDLNADQHDFVRKILEGADDIMVLINDLLDMSRIQAGKFEVRTRPIALGPVVAKVIERLRPQLEAKLCRYVLRVPADLPRVEADAYRVEQIFANLIGNAIKFSPEECHVEVGLRAQEGFVRCEVRDHGAGIDPADVERLFRPFEQGDSSATRRSGGVGLGLAIVKALVAAHGGEVGATREDTGGTTLWFTLPVASADAVA